MKSLFIMLLIMSPAMAKEVEEECNYNPSGSVQEDLISDINAITDGMYKKVVDLKVNFDGEGSLAVHYDKQGKPRLIKLNYKSKKGVVSTKVLTFDQLMKGEKLTYENKEIKGDAIIVKKAEPFNNGSTYQFKFSIRTSLPNKYEDYNLTFNADKTSHYVAFNNQKFSSIVISPGISMFSWDGTFKKVEFK